jgi:hypothetical protein
MKAVSRGQALEISARVATQVNWDELDAERLQREVIQLSAEDFRQRFTAFLQNGGRVNVGTILPIPRTQPFNPAEFIGKGWTIWRGPADGNGLEGEEEQDKRSLALTEIDVNSITLDATLNTGEKYITGKERLHRLMAKNAVRMDAGIFQTLWNDKHMIPERLKEKTNGNTTYIFVDGTTLRSPSGYRYSLYFCWDGGGRGWCWYCYWQGFRRNADNPSVLLAS